MTKPKTNRKSWGLAAILAVVVLGGAGWDGPLGRVVGVQAADNPRGGG